MNPNSKSRSERPRGSAHVMTLGELAASPVIAATVPEPPQLIAAREAQNAVYVASEAKPALEVVEAGTAADGAKVWKVSLLSSEATLLPGMPAVDDGRIDPGELTRDRSGASTDGFCPPWADLELLTKLVPYRVALAPQLRQGRSNVLLSERADEALSQSPPWCFTGKVFTFNQSGAVGVGSGVLVGPNLMMTASHVWPWGQPGRAMLFSPGFRNGHQKPTSFVSRVRGIKQIEGQDDPSGYDYVICQLEQPLGSIIGWMGSIAFGNHDDYERHRWITNGYPTWFFNGNKPTVNFDVRIVDIDNDDPGLELEVDYNVGFGGGWSGGPLWNIVNGQPRIIGIKSGWEVDVYDPARCVRRRRHMVALIKHGSIIFTERSETGQMGFAIELLAEVAPIIYCRNCARAYCRGRSLRSTEYRAASTKRHP